MALPDIELSGALLHAAKLDCAALYNRRWSQVYAPLTLLLSEHHHLARHMERSTVRAQRSHIDARTASDAARVSPGRARRR